MPRKNKRKYNQYMKLYMRNRYISRRNMLIEELGGKCIACDSTEDLQFDHKDPNEKSVDIGRRLASISMKELQEEIPKLQLLCFDCHIQKNKIDGSLDKLKPRRGEESNLSKLTTEQVKQIRELGHQYTQQKLADMFNVSRTNIGHILRRITWKHI